LFPLSLPSRGSCTIGGNLATNAGGVQVLRYGTMRQLTLGLEVVTPLGEIWDGLRELRKDNTGYDLRDLYIGSEGTLGIITAASLRLVSPPRQEQTAFAALPTIEAALALLGRARLALGESLTSFELIAGSSLDLVATWVPEAPLPYAGASLAAPWHVLIEAGGEEGISARLEAMLGDALEEGLINDAVVASSLAQSRQLWELRETRLGEAARRSGGSLGHDVSLPVSRIPEFLRRTGERVRGDWAEARIMLHSHLGDGNVHYNVQLPPGMRSAENATRVHRIVHDTAAELDGSFSAEHGVGQSKLAEIARYKSPVELGLMRAIKAALDPLGLMNPGKVLPPA
jgi:FAD/FMN-containing dehydrogenase